MQDREDGGAARARRAAGRSRAGPGHAGCRDASSARRAAAPARPARAPARGPPAAVRRRRARPPVGRPGAGPTSRPSPPGRGPSPPACRRPSRERYGVRPISTNSRAVNENAGSDVLRNDRDEPRRPRARSSRQGSSPGHRTRPSVGPERARGDADERRLAGAVRADEADDLARADLEVDARAATAVARRSRPSRPRGRAAPQAGRPAFLRSRRSRKQEERSADERGHDAERELLRRERRPRDRGRRAPGTSARRAARPGAADGDRRRPRAADRCGVISPTNPITPRDRDRRRGEQRAERRSTGRLKRSTLDAELRRSLLAERDEVQVPRDEHEAPATPSRTSGSHDLDRASTLAPRARRGARSRCSRISSPENDIMSDMRPRSTAATAIPASSSVATCTVGPDASEPVHEERRQQRADERRDGHAEPAERAAPAEHDHRHGAERRARRDADDRRVRERVAEQPLEQRRPLVASASADHRGEGHPRQPELEQDDLGRRLDDVGTTGQTELPRRAAAPSRPARCQTAPTATREERRTQRRARARASRAGRAGAPTASSPGLQRLGELPKPVDHARSRPRRQVTVDGTTRPSATAAIASKPAASRPPPALFADSDVTRYTSGPSATRSSTDHSG